MAGSSAGERDDSSLGAVGGVQPYTPVEQRYFRREEPVEAERFDRGDGRTSFQPKSDRGRGRGKTPSYHERSVIGPGGDVKPSETSFPALGGDRKETERQAPEQRGAGVPFMAQGQGTGVPFMTQGRGADVAFRAQGHGMGRGRGGRGRGTGREMQRPADLGVSAIEQALPRMQIKQQHDVVSPRPSPEPYSKPPEQQMKMSSPVPRMLIAEPTPPPTPVDQAKKPSLPSPAEQIKPPQIIPPAAAEGGGSGFKGAGFVIPHRKKRGPVVGTQGRRTEVEVNHLLLNFNKKNIVAIHYDVDFKPDAPKRLFRAAVELFRLAKYPNRHPAFDGRKNLYSCGRLPIGDEIQEEVVVNDEENSGKNVTFKVTVKFANEVVMNQLLTYGQSSNAQLPQEAIQALDVVLRNPAARSFVTVGRSFFSRPRNQCIDLGDGLHLWYGFYQSAILGWKPFVNVDVAHKGFPAPNQLLEIVLQLTRDKNALAQRLSPDIVREFGKYLKGLKVEYEITNQPHTKRTFKFVKVKDSCDKQRFKLTSGEEITVGEYFLREKRVRLRFPFMPCIQVGNEKKEIYLPIEFCRIQEGQVSNKKMTENQTAEMVRNAAKPPDVRKARIMESIQKVNYNQDPCISEFGIHVVDDHFQRVPARVLDPPRLEYYGNRPVIPTAGVWKTQRFLKPGELGGEWVILNLDDRTKVDILQKFVSFMERMGNESGIQLGRPIDIKCIPTHRQLPARLKDQIISYFKGLKENKVKLVVVVIPTNVDLYSIVKQAAELNVGILTQCVKAKTMFKMNQSIVGNILLKVNSKLNGVNHKIAGSNLPIIMREPTMIVGADVTHPSPDQTDIPSVAAVAASHDPDAFSYNMIWRLQPPRREIIQDLEKIMKTQLMFFYRKTNLKPKKIIFYRDGVSEGQFQQVLNSELNAIRCACKSLSAEYQPKVTFLVVQKRHHTRFFPTCRQDEDGKNRNVPAGTIVDTIITHPWEMDFYLVSHASLQGTSRPTKYHKLWDDSDIDEDTLEALTYYLCHLFSRCTRSVSYPAPTYYAHLAAFRARAYLSGTPLNVQNLDQEQRLRIIPEEFNTMAPMFFV